jgi:hypothetical protein
MTENMQADVQQSRQAVFVRCCLKAAKGSHNHYKHPTKTGKVTIPKHGGDLDQKTVKSILEQAGLK